MIRPYGYPQDGMLDPPEYGIPTLPTRWDKIKTSDFYYASLTSDPEGIALRTEVSTLTILLRKRKSDGTNLLD